MPVIAFRACYAAHRYHLAFIIQVLTEINIYIHFTLCIIFYFKFSVKMFVKVCYEFAARCEYSADARPESSLAVWKSTSDLLITYLNGRSLPACADMQISRSDLNVPAFGLLAIKSTIKVSFASSVPIQNMTGVRLSNCAAALEDHMRGPRFNLTAACVPVGLYSSQRVYVESSKSCCDRTKSICCPGNNVYVKTSHLATDYCCELFLSLIIFTFSEHRRLEKERAKIFKCETTHLHVVDEHA